MVRPSKAYLRGGSRLKATLVIPVGKVTVKVDVANTTTTVIGPATFNFKAGTTTVIYAIGSAAGKTLTVAVQTYC